MKNKTRLFILTISLFVFLVIGNRYIGIQGVANLYPTYKYSWVEIDSNILFYLFGSLVLAIPLNYILDRTKNAEMKSIEDAKKRIEERERKEKKLEAKNEENDKTQI